MLIDGATRLLSFADAPSGAMVINWTTPAFAAAVEAMPKLKALEVTLREASVTLIVAVPAAATRALATVALRFVESPNIVGKGDPFHSISELLVKPVPVAIKVNEGTPATTQSFP